MPAEIERGRIIGIRGRRPSAALWDAQIGRLPGGNYVAVSVSDNGEGMSEATQKRAIEPFFTTKAPGNGSGLGLSQVFGLVQECGGDLRISSAEGAGTTITMYFPTLADSVKHNESPAAEINAHRRLICCSATS